MGTALIHAICFDLFHTLIDVGQVPDSVGRYTADILGLEHSEWNESCFSSHHEIRKPTNHIDVIRTLAHSLDPNIPEDLIEQAVGERQQRFDYALLNVEKDVLEVLAELKIKKFKLALISNASTAEVSAWDNSPLKNCFDAAVFSCHCGYAKPDIDIYHFAANQMEVEPQQCLFIGDGGSNEHEGSRNAGMHPMLLSRYMAGNLEKIKERRKKVNWELEHISLLPEWLENKKAAVS